jgi:hypothetical protein
MESLKHFRARNNEVLVFHIVDPKEENLIIKGKPNLSIVKQVKK